MDVIKGVLTGVSPILIGASIGYTMRIISNITASYEEQREVNEKRAELEVKKLELEEAELQAKIDKLRTKS